MRLRVGAPIWLIRAPVRGGQYPTLTGRHHADVVIVGGGMTGASIAHVFAEAGLRVVLLEAALVGRGSTGASTALLMQETDDNLGRLEMRYGRRRARRIWQLSRAATRDLVETIRRLDIRCDLMERDAVYFTMEHDTTAGLRRECGRRRRAGFSASWLDPGALLSATGIAGAGAIRSTGNAQMDPYAACIGLLKAAGRRGAGVFERSRVKGVDAARTGVIVRTARGAVSAERVIFATGYATPAFKPLLGRFSLKHTYVLATAPVTRDQRTKLGFGDYLLWNTERPYHYARWTPDRRLLLGGNDRPVASPARRTRAFAPSIKALREYFEDVLPALRNIETEFAWEGLFAMTPDGLPYIGLHRRYPRHMFALGYGGNGMTFGFLAARLLLDAFRGIPNSDLPLFAFNRARKSRRRPTSRSDSAPP